jgi:hypothetical protein
VRRLQTVFELANTILDDTTHLSRSGPGAVFTGWYAAGPLASVSSISSATNTLGNPLIYKMFIIKTLRLSMQS